MEVGNTLYKDMDRLDAFFMGLTTWAKWVDLNVDPSKTRVFFQGISPTHYQWAFALWSFALIYLVLLSSSLCFFFFGKNSPLPFPPFCSDLRRSSSIVTYSNWSLEAVNIRWLASEASDSGRAEAGVADATNPTSHILTELYMAETGVETGTSRLRVVWESRSHCLGPLTRQACHRPPPSWTEYWAAWRPRCIFWT